MRSSAAFILVLFIVKLLALPTNTIHGSLSTSTSYTIYSTQTSHSDSTASDFSFTTDHPTTTDHSTETTETTETTDMTLTTDTTETTDSTETTETTDSTETTDLATETDTFTTTETFTTTDSPTMTEESMYYQSTVPYITSSIDSDVIAPSFLPSAYLNVVVYTTDTITTPIIIGLLIFASIVSFGITVFKGKKIHDIEMQDEKSFDSSHSEVIVATGQYDGKNVSDEALVNVPLVVKKKRESKTYVVGLPGLKIDTGLKLNNIPVSTIVSPTRSRFDTSAYNLFADDEDAFINQPMPTTPLIFDGKQLSMDGTGAQSNARQSVSSQRRQSKTYFVGEKAPTDGATEKARLSVDKFKDIEKTASLVKLDTTIEQVVPIAPKEATRASVQIQRRMSKTFFIGEQTTSSVSNGIARRSMAYQTTDHSMFNLADDAPLSRKTTRNLKRSTIRAEMKLESNRSSMVSLKRRHSKDKAVEEVEDVKVDSNFERLLTMKKGSLAKSPKRITRTGETMQIDPELFTVEEAVFSVLIKRKKTELKKLNGTK